MPASVMASVHKNLYFELKSRYPEVPDDVLASHMQQNGYDRDRCVETLASESPNFLFDANKNKNCHVNDVESQFHDVSPTEPRPRSDSAGSNMSNTSSSSMSGVGAPSRPPYSSSFSMLNTPGYRGPLIAPDDHPSTAPVLPGDISQFMYSYNEHTSQQIPSINCNNRVFESPNAGYGIGYSQNRSGTSPPTPPQHNPMLRQIEVQHVQTNRETNESVNPVSGGYTYIRIDPTTGLSAGATMVSGNQSVTHGGWIHHPVASNYGSNQYQNVTFPSSLSSANPAFSPSMRSLSFPQQNPNLAPQTRYISPTEERVMPATAYGQNQFPSQHSSQATIYLHNPATPDSQYNAAYEKMHGSYSAPCLNPNYSLPSPVSPVQQQHGISTVQPSPPQGGFTRPLYVEITSSGPDGVQSQIQYFNELAAASGASQPQGAGDSRTLPLPQHGPSGDGGVAASPTSQNLVPCNPPPFVDRLYMPERPTVINVQQGANNTSQSGDGGFMKFPPIPNVCRVPGHQQGVVKSASLDNDPVFEYRPAPPHRPFMSPASSHSSLASEPSAVRDSRPRSGSLDDPEYTQALLSHQKSRMQKLLEDMTTAEERMKTLKAEVNNYESNVIQRKRQRNSSFPSSMDIAKLRGDNLQLQADIQLITREVDLFNNGQTPLGVLDPLEQQNFYKNMNTGQRGSIYGNATLIPPTTTVLTAVSLPTPSRPPPPNVPPSLPPRDVPPPLPPRVLTSHVPPAPPPQPAVGSGDSDTDGEQWSCSACTFLNHPALNKCECCEMPRMTMTTPVHSPRDVPNTFPLASHIAS